jgi:hypothetical protein
MGVLQVTRITPQSYAAVQVSLSVAADIAALFAGLLPFGWNSNSQTGAFPGNPGGWRLTIQSPAGVSQIAYQGDWLLVTDVTLDATTGAFAVAPTSQVFVYSNISVGQAGTAVDFINTYTANTGIAWPATTTAPVATAEEGLTATLAFQQPTSADGPFTYTLTGPGTAGAFTTDANGNVTVTVTGLTEGATASWTVTVNTPYTGVTATSAASNSVTAFDTAPAPST